MWNDIVATAVGIMLSITGAVSDQASELTDKVRNIFTPATSGFARESPAATSLARDQFGNTTNSAKVNPTPSKSNQTTKFQNVKQPELLPASPPADAPATTFAGSDPQGFVLGETTSAPETPPAGGGTDPRISTLTLLNSDLLVRLARIVAGGWGGSASAPLIAQSSGPYVTADQFARQIDAVGTSLRSVSQNIPALVDGNIPDDITASNYLPLTGGTLTGDLTMSGTLTAGSLSVAGISSSGALIGPYVTATSTTATSTFAGGITGPGNFVVQSASGRVGIGTTTPAGALHVNRGSAATSLILDSNASNSTSALDFARGGTLTYEIYNYFNDDSLRFWSYTLNNDVLVLENDGDISLSNAATVKRATGNVGINQTSPTYKLDVTGLGRFTGLVDASHFVATSTTATTTLAGGLAGPGNFVVQSSSGRIGIGTTSPYAKLSVVGGDIVLAGSGKISLVPSSGPEYAFVTANSSYQLSLGTGGTERMNLSNSGKISIPGKTLEIYSLDPTNSLTLSLQNSSISTSGYFVGSSAAGGAGYPFTSYTNLLLKPATGGDIALMTNATNVGAVLKSSGNVGVASTTPWRTLSVAGTVGFDGLTSSTGAGSLCLDSNKQVVYNSASDNCLSSTRATKHDIQDLDLDLDLDSLSLVFQLQPVSFVYNEGDGRVRYGFIAEDTAAVDVHLATYDASSTVSGIDDRSILAVMVGAIKELASRLNKFAERVTSNEVHAVNLLCVGETCVTEEQFKAVFGNQPAPAGQARAGAPVADEGAPATVTTPGDGGTEPATTTTAALDSSEPREVLSPANDNRQPEGAEQSSHDGTEPAATEAAATSAATEPAAMDKASAAEEDPAVQLQAANDNDPATELPATGTE